MLWLADKLANIRSLARVYSERGEVMWSSMNQCDPAMQCWYYRTIAETVELSLNKTGAFKELILVCLDLSVYFIYDTLFYIPSITISGSSFLKALSSQDTTSFANCSASSLLSESI